MRLKLLLDVVGVLHSITYLDTYSSDESNTNAIQASNTIIAALSESILAMEGLVTQVDAIITHSRDIHLCNDANRDLEEAAVIIFSDGEGDPIVGQADDMGMKDVASSVSVPNDNSVIDISDDEWFILLILPQSIFLIGPNNCDNGEPELWR